jgi:hypothetical protein
MENLQEWKRLLEENPEFTDWTRTGYASKFASGREEEVG